MDELEKAIADYYQDNVSIKEICKILSIGDRRIAKVVDKYNLKRRTRYDIIKEDKEFFYYFAGLIAADGYLYKVKNRIELSLQIDDIELLNIIANKLSINVYVSKTKAKDRARILFACKDFFTRLENLGITQKKSETMSLNLSAIEKEYLHHFIRGYFDGDGTIFYRTKNGIVTTNVEFAIVGNEDTIDKFYQYFYDNGIELNLNKDIAPNVSFKFCRIKTGRQENIVKIKELLYNNANYFLSRKYEKMPSGD